MDFATSRPSDRRGSAFLLEWRSFLDLGDSLRDLDQAPCRRVRLSLRRHFNDQKTAHRGFSPRGAHPSLRGSSFIIGAQKYKETSFFWEGGREDFNDCIELLELPDHRRGSAWQLFFTHCVRFFTPTTSSVQGLTFNEIFKLCFCVGLLARIVCTGFRIHVHILLD